MSQGLRERATPLGKVVEQVFSALLSSLGRRAHDCLFFVLGAGILGWVLYDASYVRLITFSPRSDYWEHTAVLRALMEDPLHPEHPQLGGTLPSPRFGPHFLLVALSAKALGLDPIGAMGLSAVLNTLLFLLAIYWFFRIYFRDHRASLYGLIVMFASWNGAPHYSNVYELKTYFSVAGYPSTAALGVTLLIFAVSLRLLRANQTTRWELALLCLLSAYVYITHQLTAALAISGALLLAASEPRIALNRRLAIAAVIVAGVLATTLWPYYETIGMVTRGTAAQLERALPLKTKFYRTDTLWSIVGFAAPGLIALSYFVWRRVHLFLVLGFLTMLVPFALNPFVSVPLGHRFVLLAAFYVQAAFVWILLQFTPGATSVLSLKKPAVKLGSKLTVACALSLLFVVGVWNAAERFEKHDKRYKGRSSPIVQYAESVARIAGPSAVVFGSRHDSWPLPTFGTKIVAPLHRNPIISDYRERTEATQRFFSKRGSSKERARLLARYGATHVIVKRKHRRVAKFLSKRAMRHRLPRGYMLYELR